MAYHAYRSSRSRPVHSDCCLCIVFLLWVVWCWFSAETSPMCAGKSCRVVFWVFALDFIFWHGADLIDRISSLCSCNSALLFPKKKQGASKLSDAHWVVGELLFFCCAFGVWVCVCARAQCLAVKHYSNVITLSTLYLVWWRIDISSVSFIQRRDLWLGVLSWHRGR